MQLEEVLEVPHEGERKWFRSIFESSTDPAWIIDGQHFIDCNKAAVQTLRYTSREELLHVHPSALSPEVQPDGEPSFTKAERMMQLAQANGFHCFEWLHLRADGTPFWVEVTLSSVVFQGSQVLLCVWKDLSTRQAQEQQLRELLEEQRLIFNNAQVGILLLCNRQILKCNQHIAEMFGYPSASELIGLRTRLFYPSDAYFDAVGREAYRQLAEKGHANFETEMRRRDGSTIWVIQSGRPLDINNVLDAPSIWVYTDITERKQAGLAIQQSEEKFSTAFDSCPLAASISTVTEGRFIEVNASYERIFGWRPEDLIGRTSVEVGFWPDEATRLRWVEAMRREGCLLDYECEWVTKSGELRHVSMASELIQLAGEECILTYLTDISARKQVEAHLRIAATAFESREAMVVTDAQGIILQVNKAFEESTGYQAAEVVGKTPRLLRSGRHDEAFYHEMWESISHRGGWQGEIWDRRKNGEIYPKWLTISAVKDDQGEITHYVGTHYDITERKQAEARINALAFYDQLTGLPNRTLLLDRLNQAMAGSLRNGSHGALLFIDLDNFKTLNDTQGHEVGDQLLKEVAQRLRQCIREEDTAARLGGDEFVVVLGNQGSTNPQAAAASEAVAEKLLRVLGETYRIGSLAHHCSASIGITLFFGHDASADELMKQADLAMYRAKASGRNVSRFFDPIMETTVQAQASMERDLRQAIEARQFILHYQPQVTADQRIQGAEVLVRWEHPQRGMVSPADFIPLAEETGLIIELGMWVLDTACQQLARWAKQPALAEMSIAVNVSARQFHQSDFVERLLAVLQETRANPRRLKLELTESLLAQDVENLIQKMHDLKALGIGFSLDDFGTGYSSLSYLKRLPLDQLKIDQSFVRDVLSDPNDAAIARTVVALGQSLGLAVIAEGVETQAQRAFLAQHGCHVYQGYLFSRPLPLADFEAFVRQAGDPPTEASTVAGENRPGR